MVNVMLRKSITEITEAEFLVFVKRISAVDYAIRDEDTAAILLSEELTEHPAASDAIYFFEMPETMEIRQWQDTSLSNKEIGSAKPKKTDYILHDGDGLELSESEESVDCI